MSKLENLFICPPFQGKLKNYVVFFNFYPDPREFLVTVGPNEQALVFYKYEPIRASNFAYKSNISSRLEEVTNFVKDDEFFKSTFLSEICVRPEEDKRSRIIKLVKENGKITQRVWEDEVN